jgi:hypothetical protein
LQTTTQYEFKPDIMNQFYDEAFVNDSCTREAWYIYCYYVLRKVSSVWNTLLSKKNIKQQANIFEHITISDETLVRWFIKLDNMCNSKNDNELVQLPGKTLKKTKASISYLHLYKKEYHSIQCSRANKLCCETWNTVFWEECQIYNKSLFEQNKRMRKQYANKSPFSDLPLPGFDGELNMLELTEQAYF